LTAKPGGKDFLVEGNYSPGGKADSGSQRGKLETLPLSDQGEWVYEGGTDEPR